MTAKTPWECDIGPIWG